MKFKCHACSFEKPISPEQQTKFAGRQVTCPKCKAKTRINVLDSASSERHREEESVPIAPPSLLPKCGNCMRPIGALESTSNFNGTTICLECEARLQHTPKPPTATARRAPNRGEIICPNLNCGYVGKPKQQARGSVAVGCLLTVIMILPGLIYFALMSGYTYICPNCGVEIRSGTHN